MENSPVIQRPWSSLFRPFLYLMLFAAAVQSVWIFQRGLTFPILDLHSFRQSQTALSAFWLTRGSAPFVYETPVLGAPWEIPFEFPIFQWLVAGVNTLSGVSLDICGRTVSYFFFVLTIIPLKVVVGYFYKEREAFLISTVLLLTSPIYLFWSRTFMIETTALFASFGFIACVIRWLEAASVLRLVGATFFAIFAAMQKVTTFAPAAFVVAAIIVDALFRRIEMRHDNEGAKASLRKLFSEATLLVPTAIPIFVPVTLLAFWIKLTDHTKELNSIGKSLTSEALLVWNFGTISLRTSEVFWAVVLNRMLPEAVGAPMILFAVIIAALAFRPNWIRRGGLIAGGFLIGLLTFTNLHYVHNYYQAAISIYVILAVAFATHEIGLHRPAFGILTLLVLVANSSITFYAAKDNYFHAILSGARLQYGQTMRLAKFISDTTPKDSVVIGFGYDWSSELPYYSQRKGLMMPDWITDERLKAVLDDPTRSIGGLPVGSIVICPLGLGSQQKSEIGSNAAFAKALDGMKKTAIDPCEVYRP